MQTFEQVFLFQKPCQITIIQWRVQCIAICLLAYLILIYIRVDPNNALLFAYLIHIYRHSDNRFISNGVSVSEADQNRSIYIPQLPDVIKTYYVQWCAVCTYRTRLYRYYNPTSVSVSGDDHKVRTVPTQAGYRCII